MQLSRALTTERIQEFLPPYPGDRAAAPPRPAGLLFRNREEAGSDPGVLGERLSSRIQQLGGVRRAQRERQAAPRGRSAPRPYRAAGVVLRAPARPRDRCDRRHAAGRAGILIGRNDRIAWGLTTTGADVQDLYLERLDSDFSTHEEVIKVRGGRRSALPCAARATARSSPTCRAPRSTRRRAATRSRSPGPRSPRTTSRCRRRYGLRGRATGTSSSPPHARCTPRRRPQATPTSPATSASPSPGASRCASPRTTCAASPRRRAGTSATNGAALSASTSCRVLQPAGRRRSCSRTTRPFRRSIRATSPTNGSRLTVRDASKNSSASGKHDLESFKRMQSDVGVARGASTATPLLSARPHTKWRKLQAWDGTMAAGARRAAHHGGLVARIRARSTPTSSAPLSRRAGARAPFSSKTCSPASTIGATTCGRA